jgi:glycosyltransferase involved in cell wall biosynthesis
MSTNPLISVILSVYNGERYLRESMDSMLAQTYNNFELHIWDDGSKDGTEAILDSYRDPRIRRFKNSPNIGLYPTLNRALHEVRGERIRLWAYDDRMKPHCLEREVAFWAAHPEIGMSYCDRDRIDLDGKLMDPKMDYTPEIVEPWLAAQIFLYEGCIPFNISTVTLRTNIMRRLGGFGDMRQAADYDTWERITREYPMGHICESLMELRRHAQQFSKWKGEYLYSIPENREVRERFLERFPPDLQAHARSYNDAVISIKYVHMMMKALLQRNFEAARFFYNEARRDGRLLHLFARWLASGNGRWFRPPAIYRHPSTGEDAGPRNGRILFVDVQEFAAGKQPRRAVLQSTGSSS